MFCRCPADVLPMCYRAYRCDTVARPYQLYRSPKIDKFVLRYCSGEPDRLGVTGPLGIKRNGVPWITEEYIKLARERNFYRNKFKSTTLKADWDKFKIYRNQANNLNKRLIMEYYQDELSRCGNAVNKNWKILKHLLPNKNKETDTKLVINNELISDSKKNVDLVNEEFNTVSERLQKDTQSSSSDVNSMNTLPMMAKDFNFK